jgi:hypothetical protein
MTVGTSTKLSEYIQQSRIVRSHKRKPAEIHTYCTADNCYGEVKKFGGGAE